jgi:hypothetical protein
MESNDLSYTDLVRELIAYSMKHQKVDRGPSCRECLRIDKGHAGMEEPVCQTIEDVLDIARKLIR